MVGVIGPPGVGKSTIMNELYGFDTSSPGGFSIFLCLLFLQISYINNIHATAHCTGMLPPYLIQSEDVRAMAKHSSMGIEPRVSAERLILLDTQVLFFS